MDNIKSWILSKLPTSSFARSVITLMTGTTIAQVLSILVAPILTRLYSPGDYGTAALYASLGFLSIVACLRYELAIVLPEEDEDAANLLALSVLICLIMSGLTLVLVAVFRHPIASLLGAPELALWMWFLPLTILSAGLFQAFNYWSTRRKQFSRLAARTVTQSLVTISTQVGAGLSIPHSPGGIIGGSIVGTITATSRLAWQIARDEGRLLLSYISKAGIKRMLIRYKEFPLYSTWADLLYTVAGSLNGILLAYYFNPVVVGLYALAQRVLILPMGLIGASMAQVFFPRANEAYQAGDLKTITLNIFQQLVHIGMVPLMLLGIVGPDLFSLVFGSKWMMAGVYLQLLIGWVFFQFISSPLSVIYSVLEKQKESLIFNTVLISSRLFALIVGGMSGSVNITIALMGLTGMLVYMWYSYLILSFAHIRVKESISILGTELVKAIPYAIIPIVAIYLTHNPIVFVSSAIASGLLFLCLMTRQYMKHGKV